MALLTGAHTRTCPSIRASYQATHGVQNCRISARPRQVATSATTECQQAYPERVRGSDRCFALASPRPLLWPQCLKRWPETLGDFWKMSPPYPKLVPGSPRWRLSLVSKGKPSQDQGTMNCILGALKGRTMAKGVESAGHLSETELGVRGVGIGM